MKLRQTIKSMSAGIIQLEVCDVQMRVNSGIKVKSSFLMSRRSALVPSLVDGADSISVA